tara:strand:- start:896 stop:1492 length:597 start_codon:yes stop_codon:yes gene_type:complete
MKKAQILQFSILFLILLISYFTYNYLNTDKNYNNAKTKEKTDNVRIVEKQELKNSNVINELSYKSLDESGNIYEIKSVSGEIVKEDDKLLLLSKVKAKIFIIGYGTVFIASDKAQYNRVNLNTHFFENVSLVYQDHNVTSDNIFLKYTEKEVEISNNVKYNYENNNLSADVMSFDLIKKISKIYMTNKKEKVKIKIKN